MNDRVFASLAIFGITLTLASFAGCGGASGTGDDIDGGGASSGGASSGGASSGGASSGGASSGGASSGGASRCPDVAADPRATAERPRSKVDVAMPAFAGEVIAVPAGGDLQAALDRAVAGDIVELAAGATFTGPFTLRNHAGNGWVMLRSAGTLPAEGTRVAPADAVPMAKIVAPAGQSAIVTEVGAHHYRMVGIEFTTAADAFSYALISFSVEAAAPGDVPHHLIVDRCYLHGSATAGTRRGIALNSAHSAVIESYFTDFREVGADSQAICGWSGPGPFGIYDNYLAGAAENIMFGGAPSGGPEYNPADIEVCGNHLDKPLSWYELDPSFAGPDWVNKNLFELKNARRTLLAGNVLERSWGDGQVGWAILLTPRGEENPALDHAVQDVTVAYNIVRDVGAGISMLSRDDGTPGTAPSARFLITHNLIEVDGPRWNGAGRGFGIYEGGATADRIVITHNTLRVTGNAAMVLGDNAPIATALVVENNLFERGDYGVFGGGQGEGRAALDHYVPGYVFRANAIFGGANANVYPEGNFFPASAAEVGFVDFAGGDFRLAPNSSLRSLAIGGGALGADIEAILQRTSGVVRN